PFLQNLALRRGGRAGIVVAAVERIGQSDVGNVLGVLVVDDLRIDEEGHWHFDARIGGERLLLEAEAFDLGEVAAGKLWRHVEHGGSADRPPRLVWSLETGESPL